MSDSSSWSSATDKLLYEGEHEPIRVAERIVGTFAQLREAISSSAEGFAVLDFIQGYVAIDLPGSLASNVVTLLCRPSDADRNIDDLVVLWLANYRRAYSCLIMRVLEDGADSLTV